MKKQKHSPQSQGGGLRKAMAYPLSVLYNLAFGITLLVFHPIQWLALKLGGYHPHRISVAILNWFLLQNTRILGTRYRLHIDWSQIPLDRPYVVVSNHQSLYDIIPMIWYLRKLQPKFVSKKELGRGIPSVSFNLKYGGSALIDRKNAGQAIEAIAGLGQRIEKNKGSAVIFPEGTRSKNGTPKPFKTAGLETLLKNAPSAWILPISVNESWKMQRYGAFPNGIGTHITFDIHPPISPEGPIQERIEAAEKAVLSKIKIND
ncbi:MAG: 1-acyl-sn-glycerol-3-phosphate acyltransferase [Flavobacteriaceae bacterium]|jgi:1-acyl-sn-glycerol-3-phosphate acyltransferase|nr:1-acyl-sn-glycerol-3-phosphate acyltransferase [Flavobacteriaceae bacterium]